MGFGMEWKLVSVDFDTAELEFCGFVERESKNKNRYQVALFCGQINDKVGDFVIFDNKIKNGNVLARKYGKDGKKLIGKLCKVTKLENEFVNVEV